MSRPAIGARTIVQCSTPDVVCRISSPPGHAHPLLASYICRSWIDVAAPPPPVPAPPRKSNPTPTGTATTSATTTARSDVTRRGRGPRARCSRAPGVTTGARPSALIGFVEQLPDVVVFHLFRRLGLTHQLSKSGGRAGRSRLHRRHRYPQGRRGLLDAHVHEKTQRENHTVVTLQLPHGGPHVEPLVDRLRPADRVDVGLSIGRERPTACATRTCTR